MTQIEFASLIRAMFAEPVSDVTRDRMFMALLSASRPAVD